MRYRRLIISLLVLLSAATVSAQVKDPWQHHLDDTLHTVTVTAVKEKMRNTTQTGLTRLDAEFIKRSAVSLGTPDIIRSLLTLPGVAAGNELMSGMYVHGGDGNDNLYLLDGVPLYNISHFGGIFSSFNTDVTSGLDFYKSGFPARYGGKLSSVVDVATAPGDTSAYHGNVSLGLIDGRVHIQGPIIKGRTSFNLSYRRSWMDMMIALAQKLFDDSPGQKKAAYFMNDLNAGITHWFSKDNTLRANFFWGADDLNLGLAEDDLDIKLGVKWGNLLGSVVWDWKINKTFRQSLTAFYTRSKSDTDYSMGLMKNKFADTINSGIQDFGIRYGMDIFPNENHHLRTGADLSYKMYNYVGQSADPSKPDSESPRVNHDGAELSVYAEDESFITYNFTLNAGLRYMAYINSMKTWHSVEPRAALKWSPLYFMDIKLSYSRMSQSDHLVASTYLDLPSNTWMPSTDKIRPVTSDQVSGGLYFKPMQGMVLNIEGWYKTMNHLLYYTGTNSMFPPVQDWEKSFSEGRGLSYGLEAELSWSNDRISATGYYTLSWSKRRFDSVYPDWFWTNNDNRHKVNLLLSYKVLRNLELSANWNYHSGNRITFPTNVTPDGSFLYTEPNNLVLPDYHRLDLGLTWTHTIKDNHKLELNASVYNAYNNKNAFFAFVQWHENSRTYEGTAFSILPLFPSLSLTYKF